MTLVNAWRLAVIAAILSFVVPTAGFAGQNFRTVDSARSSANLFFREVDEERNGYFTCFAKCGYVDNRGTARFRSMKRSAEYPAQALGEMKRECRDACDSLDTKDCGLYNKRRGVVIYLDTGSSCFAN